MPEVVAVRQIPAQAQIRITEHSFYKSKIEKGPMSESLSLAGPFLYAEVKQHI